MNLLPRHSLPIPFLVRVALVAVAAALLPLLFAGQARASAGAYNLLLAEVYEGGAKRLQAQVSSYPDVAKVDLVDTGNLTPTAGELAAYDVVVSIGDNNYADEVAWGDALAGYLDAGGIVVQSAYDTWELGFPKGRYASGGYAPLVPGEAVNDTTVLGVFDPSNPLMQGIAPGSLFSTENTKNELSPGAILAASWADGRPAVASKGRAVAVTAFLGNENDDPGEPVWTGDFGRLVVNAARTLTPQPLGVVNPNPAAGAVTSTVGGIVCGSVCSASFTYGTAIGLAAAPSKGYAFAGFGGACAGSTCALTMDGPKSVTANFTAYKLGKVKLNRKKGTAKLTIRVGAPGGLVASGKKIKKRSKTVTKAGKATIAIVPKGKALKALANTGKVKVKVKLAYTPTGGSTAVQTKKIGLKLVS